MSDHLSATDRSYRQESDGGSYFAPLAQARYLLLTTLRQKGAPVSVRVQGIIDDDRAYFPDLEPVGHGQASPGGQLGASDTMRCAGPVQLRAAA